MQDSSSFWTDIKDLEERLAKFPDSLCFARLSEVYLKVGLVDDALHVARQGVIKHPRYLAGQKALSLACLAKGLNDEALTALMLVTEALPEDISSQKLLGRLFSEAGAQDAARQVFMTVLEFAPDDTESRIELQSLERSTGMAASAHEADEDYDEVIEDLEMLEEPDILEDDQPEPEPGFQESPPALNIAPVPLNDPLSTGTLAELYVKQGFIHKALEIYRAILADNPADRVVAERVVELETLEAGSSEPVTENDNAFEVETEDESAFSVQSEAYIQKAEAEALPESGEFPELESRQAWEDISGPESAAFTVPPQGVAENALVTLDGWLENIRRIKSCR